MSSCASCFASKPSPATVRSRLSLKARSAHLSAPFNARPANYSGLANSGPDGRSAAVRPRRRLLLPVLRPGRHRTRHRDSVDPYFVHLLVEEAEITLDLRAFRDRVGIGPDEIAEQLVPNLDRVVAGLALVRAAGDCLAPNEQVHPHIRGRDVVAGRQPRLEQEPGAPGLRNDVAANDDLHRAR